MARQAALQCLTLATQGVAAYTKGHGRDKEAGHRSPARPPRPPAEAARARCLVRRG
eukprot:CAMPEP_0195059936 /NCGR_PEP_ID=MMETSP0448-20130528/7309_1 /TAXON_ID=66468 /ORGANISM="Heterocapsa triquestra, Strain CCMP 448" /LENGTH=55 /DNA_ID=CAMNT_0040090281 /DNA_START=113 /DNA_END=277 /DNA_ORIENTATION=+